METIAGVSSLCRACRYDQYNQKRSGERKTDDPVSKIKKALERAEGCRFFFKHTLFDKEGKEDPLWGVRICSFVVTHGCGHKERKYGICFDWSDGIFCKDWKEKE